MKLLNKIDYGELKDILQINQVKNLIKPINWLQKKKKVQKAKVKINKLNHIF